MNRHKRFRLVGVGGTFDVLHEGHKRLLRKALHVGERVVVGVTSNRFAERMNKPYEVHPFSTRADGIRRFLQGEKAMRRVDIVQIEDEYGPAATNSQIDALVVSRETLQTAREIDRTRRNLGLPPLRLVTIEMVLAEDSKPISARRIRNQEITPTGKIAKERKRMRRLVSGRPIH